jgi:hypothetical protein
MDGLAALSVSEEEEPWISNVTNLVRCSEPGADPLAFLPGGGKMGVIMRTHDWAESSLSAPETWPRPLRTAVPLMLNTGHPM